MSRPHMLLSIPLLAAALGGPAHAQTAAIELLQPGDVFESAPYTLGFAFDVPTEVTLVTLGVFDHQRDGLEVAAEVALWQDGLADPIASALVAAGTDAPLAGDFRYAPVAPLRLLPGITYVVGAYLDGGWATSFDLGQQGSAVVNPAIRLLGDRFGDTFFNIVYPSQFDGGGGAWLGANFQTTAVPEPAAAALLAAGLGLLAGRRRTCRVARAA